MTHFMPPVSRGSSAARLSDCSVPLPAATVFSRHSTRIPQSSAHGKNEERLCASGVVQDCQAPKFTPPVEKGAAMPVDIIQLQPWIALLFGILILAVPQILNYLVAAYLILVGIGGLLAQYGTPIAGGMSATEQAV
jgi:hypothetical protein